MQLSPTFHASHELTQMVATLQGRGVDTAPLVKKALRKGVAFLTSQGRRRLRQGMSRDPEAVRYHTGNLLRSFTARVKRTKAGALAGFQLTGRDRQGRAYKGYHAWLVDRGTAPRHTSEGYNRGRGGHAAHGSTSHALGYWTATQADVPQAIGRVEAALRVAFDRMMFK